MPDTITQATAAPSAKPPKKSFDVAIVDPLDHTIEHWPRIRVTVDADSPLDQPASKRERDLAIAAYNPQVGLTKTDLPYDVRLANGSAPVLPRNWQEHTDPVKGAPYWRKSGT